MKIIAADDNEANRKLLGRMFGKLGHQIDLVPGGSELVEAVLADSYDLILVDLQMPGIDGATAVRMIREGSEGKLLPACIALTGFEERLEYYEAGFDGYLGKPFTLDDLSGLVRKYAPGSAT
ncbi:MAG: response regulator [Spirochaetes bacterium]|nr:response regulator [Spirochaetota bacterium]